MHVRQERSFIVEAADVPMGTKDLDILQPGNVLLAKGKMAMMTLLIVGESVILCGSRYAYPVAVKCLVGTKDTGTIVQKHAQILREQTALRLS